MMSLWEILLLLCSHSFVATKARNAAARRPNFIFMFADDLGFGDLKSYGHPYAKTDNVDRLAREGTAFRGFHNTGNICPNSRTGFMTSRNPSWFPNYNPDYGFRGAITVTQLLKDAGYVTGHIGKWNIGKPKPPQSDSGIQFPEYGMMDVRITGDGRRDPRGKEAHRYDLAIDFVEKYRNDPFYLQVWQYVPHEPILPAAYLQEAFEGLQVDRSLFGPHMQGNFDRIISSGGNINTSMKNYLAEVYGMDIHIGRLLDRLDELGLAENTVVVFSSDNGPAVNGRAEDYAAGWAGGLRGGKHRWYEGGPSVPFLVRWPGQVPAGKVNDESFFSALDWLPTICSLAGAEYPENLVEGEDISDIWKGSNRSRKNPTFYQDPGSSTIVARYGRWKLFRSTRELYDMNADREETDNVYDEFPDVVAAMRDLIDQYDATIPRNHAFGSQSPLPFDPAEPVQEYVIPDVLREATPPPTSAPTPVPLVSSSAPTFFDATSSSSSPSLDVTSLSTSPTLHVTSSQSKTPSALPTVSLSAFPSPAPTTSPHLFHSSVPTGLSNTLHSDAPTASPSASPSYAPTTSPSASPSYAPTTSPSASPSYAPTDSPSAFPSFAPSSFRSASPSMSQSLYPSNGPSVVTPTIVPSTAVLLPTNPPATSSPSSASDFHLKLPSPFLLSFITGIIFLV